MNFDSEKLLRKYRKILLEYDFFVWQNKAPLDELNAEILEKAKFLRRRVRVIEELLWITSAEREILLFLAYKEWIKNYKKRQNHFCSPCHQSEVRSFDNFIQMKQRFKELGGDPDKDIREFVEKFSGKDELSLGGRNEEKNDE
jgi:hypothetical protein